MKEINLNLIIERISDLCIKNNLSINQMLKKCGAGVSLIDNMKKGSAPSVEKLNRVAAFFNVTVDYLLGEATEQEMQHTKKYTVLDTNGKDTVDTVLDREYKRCKESSNTKPTPMDWAIPPVDESLAVASKEKDTFKLDEAPIDEEPFEKIPNSEV